MTIRSLVGPLRVLLAVSCLACVSAVDAAEPPSDAETLGQLAKSGSDLSKLHRVEFFLHFPTEDDAARATAQLEDLAFATTTERGDSEDEWVVLASKVMYPVESDLKGLRDKLNIIAAEGHGTYGGWQARLLAVSPNVTSDTSKAAEHTKDSPNEAHR